MLWSRQNGTTCLRGFLNIERDLQKVVLLHTESVGNLWARLSIIYKKHLKLRCH